MSQSAPSPSPANDAVNQYVTEAGQGEVAGQRLKAFIERIERLEEEKKSVSEDIRDIYGEAKAAGFEVKIIRKLIKLRGMETQKRREEEEILELYKSAIGLE